MFLDLADAVKLEMAQQLDRALHGDETARSQTPAQVWQELLHEVVRMREWQIDAKAALDQYEDLRASIEGAMARVMEIR